MSDLANSCEYLTSEKSCSAVSEDEKAKASREVRCKNNDKTTCCYLCMLVFDCATPCRFLGSAENKTDRINQEQNQNASAEISEQKLEEDKTEKTENEPVNFCSSCNVEMSQTKTKFRIDGWEKTNKKSQDETSTKPADDMLSVLVFVCPQCGKIEFRADKN